MQLIERFFNGGASAAAGALPGGGSAAAIALPGAWPAQRHGATVGRDDAGAMASDADHRGRALERLDDAALLELTPRVPQAFGIFFARHRDAVAAFLTRQTGSPEVAAEVTAEAFAVMFESAERYDRRRGEARGWLFGIARITMLASLRNKRAEDAARRRLGVTVAGHSEEAWDEVESRIDAALTGLLAGVSDLPRAERNAVLARVVEERDYADIADSEHATEAAIRQRVRRGLARLRANAEERR